MMTYVLRSLIGITGASSRRAYQGQPQSLVIGFVGSVFAISEYRDTVGSVLIGQIEPLMRGNFELAFLGVGPLHCADVPVVSRHFVRSRQWERGFQICAFGFPVDRVAELDAIAGITCRKADGLNELGIFGIALDFDGDANRTALDDFDLCRPANECTRRPLLVFKIHVPRRPLPWVVGRDRQANRRGQELAFELLIKDARYIAALVDRYAITFVFQFRF